MGWRVLLVETMRGVEGAACIILSEYRPRKEKCLQDSFRDVGCSGLSQRRTNYAVI